MHPHTITRRFFDAFRQFDSTLRRIDAIRAQIPHEERPYSPVLAELYDSADMAVRYIRRHKLAPWPREVYADPGYTLNPNNVWPR